MPLFRRRNRAFVGSNYHQDVFKTRIKAELAEPWQPSQTRMSGRDRESVLTRPLSMHTRLLSRVFCVCGGPVVLAYWLVVWLWLCASISPPYFVYTREAVLRCAWLLCCGGSTLPSLYLCSGRPGYPVVHIF